jgi:pimeloyl-ACP methyl ester carboxylesterase
VRLIRTNTLSRRVLTIALATVTASLPLAPASAEADGISCADEYVPTALGVLHGVLCAPNGARTVEVLIPGGTYNSSYWDIGFQPETHSFRLAMNNAGYATFALDRLGTGKSAKPLSVLVTATTQADAAHEAVQALRHGTLGPRFDKVIVGGHSIGSAMAMIEAGTYRDVDGVLVTGFTHRMNYLTVAPTLVKMVPSLLDAKLGSRGEDPGYVTTLPGTRYEDFHTPGPYVAGAIDNDESTKDVFALTEAVDTIALNSVVIPISRHITAPVLIVQGDDPNFCGPPLGDDCSSAPALHDSEAPFFPAARSLRAFVLHGYGHAINYAPNAPVYFQQVVGWASSTV